MELLNPVSFSPTAGLVFVITLIVAAQPDLVYGQETHNSLTPANNFPATTAIYVQVDQPAQLIEKIEQHPLVSHIGELAPVKKLMLSPQFAMAMVGKGLVESQIGQSLLDAAKINLAEGLALGVDAETGGLAIVFKSSDEAKLKRLAGTILRFVAGTAEQDNKPAPFKKGDYRGVVTAQFDKFLIGRYQTWFIIANKPQLAKKIADNLIDGSSDSLADQTWFQQSQKAKSAADAWVALDLETIRAKGLAKKLFQGRSNNPAAELVIGGILDALQQAPSASGQVTLNEHLELLLTTPFDPAWANPARRFFFGEDIAGVAPSPLMPENIVANLVSYRDLSDWWLSKEDLYDEAVIARLAQSDTQLSNIFSGMDFGEDVLGALEPGVQIVLAEKTFGEKYVPDIRLPAFALIGRLKEPEQIRRKLKIVFQSVVGFANLGLGMQGQPQLDLETETIGDAKISTTQYVVDDQTEEGLILFNFSPTMAFQGPFLILSSDRELAVELTELAGKPPTTTGSESPVNTRLQFDAAVISRMLKDNRESLIAQNMLEKGHGRKKSEEEIEVLLLVIDLFKNGQLDFQVKPNEMRLDASFRFVKTK